MKGFSLRPTLVTSVTCIILLATGLVGGFAYFESKEIIFQIWNKLADLISRTTTEKTLSFLNPAVTFLKFSLLLEESKVIDNLDINKPPEIMQYCYAALKTNLDFTWVSFAMADGSFIAAYRDLSSNEVIVTWRQIQGKAKDGKPKTFARNFKHDKSGELVEFESFEDDFDPRLRPYWKVALNNPNGAWSPSYSFWTGKDYGVAYVQPQILNGEVTGVWAVEFRLAELSEYLAVLEKTFTGPIALISKNGTMIATSVGIPSIQIEKITPETPFQFTNTIHAEDDPKLKVLFEAWNFAQNKGLDETLFRFGDYLGVVKQFPKDSNIPWNVLTLMPEKELFAPVVRQAWNALLIAAALCLLCIITAALFFGHISKILKEIAYEMHMIKHFNFSDHFFSGKTSLVKEINMMNKATDSMKIGLQSFSKYVSVQLVQDLIHSGHAAALGGAKEDLTILFTDLANFTSLAEKIPPKELLELLEQYLEVMSDIILAHQGTVDKYIGDSIMAFWGAPKYDENHPVIACTTALDMKRALHLLWEQWEKDGKPLLKQRIGINTGNAIVGNIGSPTRMDYTAIGDNVNLASRLEGLNKYYGTQILIGESTAQRVSKHFLLRPIDWVAVKGKSVGGLIYELMEKIEDANEDQKNGVKFYTEALHLYRNRQFDEAIKMFQQANDQFGGNDEASRVLTERCHQFMSKPPESDWAGFTSIKEK